MLTKCECNNACFFFFWSVYSASTDTGLHPVTESTVTLQSFYDLNRMDSRPESNLVLPPSPDPTIVCFHAPSSHHRPSTHPTSSPPPRPNLRHFLPLPSPTLTTFLLVFPLAASQLPQKRPDQHYPQLPNRLRKQRLDLADRGDCHFLLSLRPQMIYAACVTRTIPPPPGRTFSSFLSFLSIRIPSVSFPPSLHANVSSFLSLAEPPPPRRKVRDSRCLRGTERRGSPRYMI